MNSGTKVNDDLSVELGPYPYLMTYDGLGVAHMDDDFAASWATPLILSYVNSNKQEALSRGEVFSISNLHNSKIIVDPVKYKQFELFRLGRL
jgi:hypothetical protein